MLFAEAVEVNALAQVRRITQWPWIEHPTFQLGSGHSTTDLIALSTARGLPWTHGQSQMVWLLPSKFVFKSSNSFSCFRPSRVSFQKVCFAVFPQTSTTAMFQTA